MKMLTYVVVRGMEKGVVLTLHKGNDDKNVACLTRLKKDYVKVERVADLVPLMQKGYGLRVRNKDSDNHRMPSLFQPFRILGMTSERS